MYPIALSGPVQTIAEFERLGLVNKSVIDAVAVDVPLITLANNKIERKERAFRQALVLTLGFLIAPLHSKLLSKHFSKSLGFKEPGVNEALFRTSFKDLQSVEQLKKGIERIFKDDLKKPLPPELNNIANETFRKTLLATKSKFLIADLAVLCTLFSSIGFFKVLFGNKLSGKKQFTGELGTVSQKKLDQIYETENKKQDNKPKHWKEIITLGLGGIIPALLGLAIWRNHKVPGSTGFIKKLASFFDYQYPQLPKKLQNWPMMSNAGLILSALVLTMGELMSARSKREFKSLAIQRNSIDFMFFLGTPMIMAIINRGTPSIHAAIEKAAKTTNNPVILKKVANRSATAFVISFLLNMLTVAGIVTLTNKLTKKEVKQAANQLPASQKPLAQSA